LTSSINDKKQLSFVYQPGVGLYDKKKTDLDQDLRIISTTADVDERIQVIFIFYIEEIISFFLLSFSHPNSLHYYHHLHRMLIIDVHLHHHHHQIYINHI
jgi:hypothetical protein